jgi:hypothetical protein
MTWRVGVICYISSEPLWRKDVMASPTSKTLPRQTQDLAASRLIWCLAAQDFNSY